MSKKNFRKVHNELVKLTAEADQMKARQKDIVAELKRAIASGEYSLAQAEADMRELGFSNEQIREHFAMIAEGPDA
jgi:anti-sigma28 factor (negative regulator of flagellin synthesis)